MRRQRAAAGTATCLASTALLRITLLAFSLVAGDRLLQCFEAELQLVFRQALGFGAELHALEF
jgi:hypothetical protein